jgi:hypothetical protein
MLSAREAGELTHVETRLLEKFVPPLRPEDVRRCLLTATERHESARVRTYLTILVERAAGALLASAMHDAATRQLAALRTAEIVSAIEIISPSSLSSLDPAGGGVSDEPVLA